jgi:Bacterial Ig domain/Calcineurin-like phosphoesterase
LGRKRTRTIAVALAVAGAALACPAVSFAQTSILLAAGDVASCTTEGDEFTAQILDVHPGTIAVIGDVSQTDGSLASFLKCYDPTWGRHKARTRPAPGNHDYRTLGAEPYYAYFGELAGPPGLGYYSYDLGAWHIVSLNSNCMFVSCAEGSPQEQWLRADLATHPAACTLAYWHHPRFSSGRTPQLEDTAPFWDALYEAGAELVLTGHDHIYERFAPQTPNGDSSSAYGIREFIVGTGGFSHSGLQPVPLANSELRNNDAFGVLELALEPAGYSWTFLSVPGGTLADSGTGTCHNPPADTTRPWANLTLPAPGAVVHGVQTVAADAFDGAADPARVDFLVDQTVIATDTTRPYAIQWETTGIPDGARTLKARAVDAAGNARTDSRPVVIDNSLPATTIVKGPTGVVRTTRPAFYLRSEPGATFSCSLNGGPYEPCSTPAVYSGLDSGRHVFKVRSRDAAGNLEPTPKLRKWTIDRTAPATKLVRRKATTRPPGRALFAFKADEAATFRCSLDDEPWLPCVSPVRYAKVGLGRHTFRVRAVDRLGNVDLTPAAFAWRVERRLGFHSGA